MDRLHIRQNQYIPQLSIDCVIFGYDETGLKVLIPKLIFKGGFCALPGGYVLQEEDIDVAAARILRERTGIDDIYLHQFKSFGNADRNSKSFFDKIIQRNPDFNTMTNKQRKSIDWMTNRFITIGYYALTDIGKVIPQRSSIDKSVEWYNIYALPKMIMDHGHIIHVALDALRKNLDDNLLAFKLLPEKFTMKDVQQVYETICETTFVRTNFQKKILELDVLERLDKKFTGAANKAPFYYRMKH